jgi:multicomponent Na+:H+ antiporter subunit E
MTKPALLARAAAARPATLRVAGLFLLWIVLSDGARGGLLPGIAAALAAAAISLRLLPPSGGRLRAAPLVEFAVRFLGKSLIAGVDVGRRALDPRLPVNPGLLRYPVGVPRGALRNTLTILTGLLPGTVSIGPDERDRLVVHCLDLRRPNAEQLAVEEALLVRVMGGTRDHG